MKIAIYSRKSRETDTGDSIENQITLCKEYCNKNYLDEKIDFLIYEDEGFSGKNTNRPEFQKLISDIKDKKINKLICYRLDRISRSVADFSTTLELLQSNDCDFISIKEQFDTSTPMGRAMIYIASVFAQLERETIAERVRDNMIQMAKNGQWLGGTPPLGYTTERIKFLDESLKERTMCRLVPNDEELELVKYIYNLYLSERSVTKVVNTLIKENIKTRSEKYFESIAIIRILKNPIYVKSSKEVHEYFNNKNIPAYGEYNGNGYLTYGKTKRSVKRLKNDEENWIVAVSMHKGIFESEKWLEVQDIMLKNKDKQFKRTGTGNNPALLSGLLKCSKCGSNMVVRRNGDHYYYICSGKVNKIANKCNCKNIRVDQVDNLIVSKIQAYSKDFLIESMDTFLKQNSTNYDKQKIDTIREELKEKNNIVSSLIKRVALAPSDDVATILMNQISNINNETIKLQNQLDDIQKSENQQKVDNKNLKLFIQNVQNFNDNLRRTDDVFQKRYLLQGIVKNVIWDSISYEATINFLEDIEDNSKKKLNMQVESSDNYMYFKNITSFGSNKTTYKWNELNINLNCEKITIDKNNNHPGYYLKLYRMSLNLSLATLGSLVGSDRHQLSNIEKELYLPTREISIKLARYFKLNTKYFFDSYLEEADDISEKLIIYRKKNNLTVTQAAKLNKTCSSSWKGWENGSILISREKYIYLKELGVI